MPTWTLTADFEHPSAISGTVSTYAVNCDQSGDQLDLYDLASARPPPYVWIPTTGGVLHRIDADTGTVLGSYRTTPTSGGGGSPSRVSQDLYGNVWVANRTQDSTFGSRVTRVGLVVGGTRCDADGTTNATGDYLKPPFQYNTCIDRDQDGLLYTSRGVTDVRAWSAETPTGITTAATDEAIYFHTRPAIDNTMRHCSVDANGDCWVSYYPVDGQPHGFYKVSATTGQATLMFSTSVSGTALTEIGGHGGIIGSDQVLWSTSIDNGSVLRYDIQTNTKTDIHLSSPTGHTQHNLCRDNNGNIYFITHGASRFYKLDSTGAVVVNVATNNGGVRGIAYRHSDDTVWAADTTLGQIRQYSNTGTLLNTYTTSIGAPRGLAFDYNGKLWWGSLVNNAAHRFNTATGLIDLSVSLGPCYPYDDMAGMVRFQTLGNDGFWNVVYDGGRRNSEWGTISWSETVPVGASVTVRRRFANSQLELASIPWTTCTNGADFCTEYGQYAEIIVELRRGTAASSPVVQDVTLTACAEEPTEDGVDCAAGFASGGVERGLIATPGVVAGRF